MDSEIAFCLLAILTTIYFIYKSLLPANKKKNLPPSPPSLPILGHLHLLKPPFHHTLHDLAQRYGPIFSLRLGRHQATVVSDPCAIEQCLTQNDTILANRPKLLAGHHLGYNNSTLLWAPHGDHWRNLRRVTTLLALSGRRVNEGGPGRKEEMHCLVKELIERSSETRGPTKVNLTNLFEKVVRNLVMRAVNGKRWDYDYKKSPPASLISTCDFLPFLKWVGFKGDEKKLIDIAKDREIFMNGLIDEFKEKRRVDSLNDEVIKKTMIHELLDLQQGDPHHYTDDILKGIIMAILNAGLHTSVCTLEFAMSLLLIHPKTLAKARTEIDVEISNERLVDDSDLPKLSYLRCIINETLRLFPPAPLLGPHYSSQDCKISEYDIEKGTMVLVNAWALHRDPKLWDKPNRFIPERFNEKKDEFKFIPFGMGKRSCPGDIFALRNITLILATIIQCFDWEKDEDTCVDIAKYDNGLIMAKDKQLQVIYHVRSSITNVL